MLLRQGEDGEAFRDVVLEPVGEAVGGATVGGDQVAELLLRGLQRGGIPDRLSNLTSGLLELGRSGIQAVPVDVDAV